MRVLFVVDEFPWPVDNGYRIRVANLLQAVTEIADVDMFVASDPRSPDTRIVSVDAGLRRICSVDRPPLRHGPLDVARWTAGALPRPVMWRRWDRAAIELASFVRPPYDLVWFSHCETFIGLGFSGDAPTVIDVDNLESCRLSHRLRRGACASPAARIADRIDAGRWARLERRLAGEATTLIVCSDLDRRRLGFDNVVVVPNGYDPAPDAARSPRRLGEGPPTALLAGLLTYPPNADAAHFLGRQVWPRVRERVQGAALRIVGDGGEALGEFGPGVTVTGRVADMAPELSSAHLATVPVRYGGGTRIKLLEAFAHSIPTVATTIGAEGIDAVDGRHLLVADEAASFADACVVLLTDDGRRRTLASEAHELWRTRYRWAPIKAAVQDLVRDAAHACQRSHSGPSRGSSSHGPATKPNGGSDVDSGEPPSAARR